MTTGMAIDFSGKTVLVTGASTGIGLAVASKLVRAGAQVLAHGRDPERVAKAVARLGQSALPVVADLAAPEAVSTVVSAVGKLGARVDVLINNAAEISGHDLMSVTVPELEHVMRTNAFAGLGLAQEFGRVMFERNAHGRVVWISSDAGVIPQAAMTAYGLSKMAMIFLARGFNEAAMRAGADTVTSTAVVVGPTSTPGCDRYITEAFGDGSLADAWDAVMQAHSRSLVRRPLAAEEVADVIVWLASPLSSAIRGSVVRADGGTVATL